ncbi:MAG: Stp1/IreP family PP2C-type Ser/Thr phosphatase [Actinomycetota bacterium]
MRLHVGARTDVGRVRQGNEDSYTAKEPLFAVADGMGGHQGGEVASSLALEVLTNGNGTLEKLVREANDQVFQRAAQDPGLSGMGTTLTALRADGDVLRLAHVGDSRAYMLRDGRLQRLTKDHTVVERLVDEGKLTAQEAEIHPQRNILTRALGVDEALQVDQGAIEPRPGDRLLLCSDGLHGMVDEERIAHILAENADPQAAADSLVGAANEAGGQDNITAIVIDVLKEEGEGAGRARTEVEPPRAAKTPPRVRGPGRRALLWLVMIVVVIGGALWAVKALWVDGQFYVGESNGSVALYQGIPAAPLGFDLSTPIEEFGDLPAVEITRFPEYEGLSEGITATSEEDARSIIGQMRAALSQTRMGSNRIPRRCYGCGAPMGLFPEDPGQ